MQDGEDRRLEGYIEDWHSDELSHQFAKALGKYLFEFMDHFRTQRHSEKTLRKHIDNCWCIGYLECAFGYKDYFGPGEVFCSPDPAYDDEFRRKFHDSRYAVESYRATWRKLYSYTKALGYLETGQGNSQEHPPRHVPPVIQTRGSDPMCDGGSEWSQKGATLSDTSARKEFGLTQEEIIDAINEGKLQYHLQSIYGNPFLRLIRREVEALVEAKYGGQYLTKKKAKEELPQVNSQINQLKTQLESLEERRKELLEALGE
jgi:hypothetical protein